MNPLLKHPILKHMPYKVLNSPTRDSVKAYLSKRRRRLRMLTYLSIVGVAIGMLLIVDTPGDWDNYLLALGLLFVSAWSFVEQKKTLMSDEEINRVLHDGTTNDG